MKLVLLSILIGIVLPTSSSFTNSSSVKRNSQEIPNPPLKGILKKSGTINTTREKSDLRVRFSSTCKWGGLSLQQLRELTNSSVRMLLEGEIEGITDTDCMLVYRVDNKDGGRPFYPFRIDRQNRTRKPSVYGIISLDDGGNFTWKSSRRRQFEHYPAWCDRKDESKIHHSRMPRFLTCTQTRVSSNPPPTTPATRVTPITPVEEVVPTTTKSPLITSPREVTPEYYTRWGLLSMLNCLFSACF